MFPLTHGEVKIDNLRKLPKMTSFAQMVSVRDRFGSGSFFT